MPTPVNPYSPPETSSELVEPIRSRLSRLNQVLVTMAAISFLAFTVLLLNSSPMDKKGGQVFLLNVPFVLAWLASVWAAPRYAQLAGVACGVMQCGIALVMIASSIGDYIFVVLINFGIAIVPFVLARRTKLIMRSPEPKPQLPEAPSVTSSPDETEANRHSASH